MAKINAEEYFLCRAYRVLFSLLIYIFQGAKFGVSRSECQSRFLANIKNDCNGVSDFADRSRCMVSSKLQSKLF